MTGGSPHEVLGVPRNATSDQARKAFRRKARTCHPDIDPTPGAAERFMALKAAHDEMQRLIERGEEPFQTISVPREQQAPMPFDVEALYETTTDWRDLVRPVAYAAAGAFWLVLFGAWSLWLNAESARCIAPDEAERPRVRIVKPTPARPGGR